MRDGYLRLDDPWFPAQFGRLVREARELVGWTQRELASSAGSSQAVISRLESGKSETLDLRVAASVLSALGIRGSMIIDARHLDDRRRQRDPVHARLVACVRRRLERAGWQVATEVPIGTDAPRGWIDVLAYRATDGAGLMIEVKGDLPDMGELQRQLAYYSRMATGAARAFGWQIERLGVAVVALDSSTVGRRIIDNAALLRQASPGTAAALDAWIRSPLAPAPRSPTIALADPASRAERWLRPAPLDSRRRPAAYIDYADAAARLRVR